VDIASDREVDRIRRQLPEADHSAGADTLHLEIGNRLLASMGGHGREFQALIAQSDCPLEERFEDLVPDTLLRALQHDLLHLTQRGCGPGGKVGQPPGTETDHSIQIHACHGPMREIEILQDQLLAILDRHPDLEPRDILVLTPDIETYAPYIQAVFGSRADERLYLPFSIADRRLETASPLVETFKALLDLRASRFTSSEILTLLEFGPLRAQFELAETDLDLIASWIARARIRWGMDGASKEAWDLPPIDANTWRGGLDRLILGYAMQAEPDRLFQDILPQDRVQGSQAVVLGRLSGLIETLWEFSRDLATPRTWTRWRYRMAETLTDFFVRDERYEYDFQVLERLFEAMHHGGSMAAFNEPVDLDIVRAYLDRHLSRESYRGGFIAGGITFGALLPMRSIPAEVICLVGMNHDLFPRRDRPRSFDLMALNPRLGDRSRRSDDRYLFLEALISARRCIYISYAGFDVHDNSIRPPSVLVGELTDYLQEGFGLSEDDLVTSHRLQAFSPAYFNGEDPRLFSFNRDNAQAARNLAAPSRTRPEAVPFLHCALEKCPEHFLTLTPEDLLEALAHPCRFLLEKRLDLQLRPKDRPDEDREAFDLDALEKYREGQWLTAKTLEGMPFASALPLQKARGILPHGETGRTVFQRLADDVAEFSDRIRPHVDPPPQPPRSFQIALEGFLLRGRLETLFTNGPVIYRYAQTNARALLGAWIQHLIYCRLALAEKACGSTVLICRDEVRQFNFVEKSLPILNQLLDLYFQAAHIPLPIFPRATVAFARQRFAKRKPAPQAFQAAQRAWEGSRMFPGDKDDPYIALGFRGRQPWTEDFEEVAARLFEPIFEHSEIIV
ncbi:MAG: exodeoxyribonuclease V subunit gamma, partial [Desulfosarcina sp.]|nr:exodeoxyribonuclease V subunit gamma [Desulfobacterales bacterium]